MSHLDAKRGNGGGGGGGSRGRSSFASVAARALGLDASEGESREGRGVLRNPFARDNDDSEHEIVPNCHIGVGSSFRGTLMIEGTLLVDGDFEGDILNCDRIVVGPYGHVQADVHVREGDAGEPFDCRLAIGFELPGYVLVRRSEFDGDTRRAIVHGDILHQPERHDVARITWILDAFQRLSNCFFCCCC